MPTVTTTDTDFEKTCYRQTSLYWLISGRNGADLARPLARLEEIADSMNGEITIAKLNIDENPATPQSYNVRGIPTFDLQGRSGCR